ADYVASGWHALSATRPSPIGPIGFRVRGRAVAWTDKAVWVEFEMRGGARRRAWVWASAVDRV
ncbi:hypothetical protein ACC691_38625, partial [Rhizobium johnstonii]|uniref:hypothetical protein n=1 Tax=Rhizobium johnstonii TaxID=3019933 RepID=UPI003F9B3091